MILLYNLYSDLRVAPLPMGSDLPPTRESPVSSSRRSSEGQVVQLLAASSLPLHSTDPSDSSADESSLNLRDAYRCQDEVASGKNEVQSEIINGEVQTNIGQNDASRGQSEVGKYNPDDVSPAAPINQLKNSSAQQQHEKTPVVYYHIVTRFSKGHRFQNY